MENLPVLLAVRRDKDDLVLRVDLDSLAESQEQDVVLVLRLENCADVRRDLARLTDAIGEITEFEVYASGVEFYIDFGREEFDIRCSGCSEARSELTVADLIARSHSLSKALQSYAASWQREQSHRIGLMHRLEREARTQIDRSRRKYEFFEATKNPKALAMEAEIRVYKRVLNIISEDQQANTA